MNRFVWASANDYKREELSRALDSTLFSIEMPPAFVPVVEDGESFFENAQKKAQAYVERFKMPALSDDSGLVVSALPDELGVRTARFGGEGLTDRERALKLLEAMKDHRDRTAVFVCVLCFFFSKEEIFFFEGRMKGKVAQDYRGEGGFGYDPVFIPAKHEGPETLAQIPSWKDTHSHRVIACREASFFFKNKAQAV